MQQGSFVYYKSELLSDTYYVASNKLDTSFHKSWIYLFSNYLQNEWQKKENSQKKKEALQL